MKEESLYAKYNISKDTLNHIVICMMGTNSLFEAKEDISADLTHEQIFAIGKFYSENYLGMPFDEMSPRWVLDRYKIQDERSEEVQEIIKQSKESKRIKKIEEELYYIREEKKESRKREESF